MNEADGSDTVLAGLVRALRDLAPAADDTERVDRIRRLEELKSVAAAVQVAETAAFCASQRDAQRAAGVPAERAERGIAQQVGLAKRTSPFHARRYLGWAKILTRELPATLDQLRAGAVPEWRAMLVARETAWLSRQHRAVVDAQLAPQLERFGDRHTVNEAKRLGYELDPDGYLARIRNVENDRHVCVRPAPDVMCRVSALLPVAQGVSAFAALSRDADTIRATGADARSRGQVMADLFVERLTGRSPANGVPIEVNLVMPADTLLQPPARSTDRREEPAHLDGYGPLPAPLARDWLVHEDRTAPTWLRRLYTSPDGSRLISMDSRRRCFTAAQRKFLRLRDQTCRTPYCGAAVRHADHVTPAAAEGTTSLRNGQSDCESCNYDKEAPGWEHRAEPDGTIVITTPTGHQYESRPPRPPLNTPPDAIRARPRQIDEWSPADTRIEVDYLYFHAA